MNAEHIIEAFRDVCLFVGETVQEEKPEEYQGDFWKNFEKNKKKAGTMLSSLLYMVPSHEIEHILLSMSKGEIGWAITESAGLTLVEFRAIASEPEDGFVLNSFLSLMDDERAGLALEYFQHCFSKLGDFGVSCVRDVA